VEGSRLLTLKVSNGFCEDSTAVSIPFSPKLKADFTGSTVACPNEVASFVDQSTGPVFSWNWDFGNGSTSTQQIPGDQQYISTGREREVPVQLIISDGNSCYDTIIKPILVVPSCVIAVPSAFTPNNDGKNDWLYPSNAYKASELLFRVYNRYGQVVFETRDWTKRWDGTFKGKQLETGTYVYFLQYTLSDTGKKFSQKGTTVLIR
jgi:gliding motility-associated-like protein